MNWHPHTLLLSSALLWHSISAQSNTTCASTQLDWYTNVVGETPCVTYQRLRQICNTDYEVQKFRSNTPGDNCDDQLSSCCCNSISWALSMLCMNCQYDAANQISGIDSIGVDGYQHYLGSCLGKEQNQTLPGDIQAAVCHEGLKVANSLYGLFWAPGDWYYKYTKDTFTKDILASNNNTFTHCASTTNNGTTTSSSSQPGTTTNSSSQLGTTTSSSSQPGSSNVGPIVGGVVGGIATVVLVAVAFFFWRRQRRMRGPRPLDLSKEYEGVPSSYTDGGHPDMDIMATPFSGAIASGTGSRYSADDQSDPDNSGTYALLPKGASDSEGGVHQPPGSPTSEVDMERHEDAGPVALVQRSTSGRLPPAYRSWDTNEPGDPVPSNGLGSSNSSSSAGERITLVSSASDEQLLRPQYQGDVKLPLRQL